MSLPRTMGAGLAGSSVYGANVNQIQFGDKLQGLAPQATHFFIAGNGLGGWNNYRTRTNAPKRNFVFCMNQLGGVGASRSPYKIRGLNSNLGGAKRCTPYAVRFGAGTDGNRVLMAHLSLNEILNRFLAANPDVAALYTPSSFLALLKANDISPGCYLHQWQYIADGGAMRPLNNGNPSCDSDGASDGKNCADNAVGPCGANVTNCMGRGCPEMFVRNPGQIQHMINF